MAIEHVYIMTMTLLLGFALGSVVQNALLIRYIRASANPEHRTACCIGGDFFYIISEAEYIEALEQGMREAAMAPQDDDLEYLH